jgi:hypothetical protein
MGGFQPLSIPIPAAKMPVESSGNRLHPLIAEPINRRPMTAIFGAFLRVRACNCDIRRAPRIREHIRA